MINRYDEAFTTNAVAVVRSGYGVRNLAKRLGISATSLENWLKDPRYSDVRPEGADLVMSLFQDGREPTRAEVQPIVRIRCPEPETANVSVPEKTVDVTLRFGRLRMELCDGISIELLATLVRTLGETGVL